MSGIGITIKDIGDTFGSLNELDAPPGPSGDRRITSTTEALSAALAKAYTPDSLEGRTTFIGIVLISYPTKLPRQGSKQELIHSPTAYSGTDEMPGSTIWPFYDIYKVYIPELECRPLDWENTAGDSRPGGKMSLQQRVMTFDDVIPSAEFLRDQPGPIPPGTLCAVEYEDITQLKNPRIVGISPAGPAFEINLQTGETSLVDAWDRESPHGALGGLFWSNRQAQKTATWHSTNPKYSYLNGTVMKNGDLQDIPGFFVKHAGGAKLQIAAAADWARLASAYANRFGGEVLTGGGYRPYSQQVAVRKLRLKGDRGCPQPCHGRTGDRTGSGKCSGPDDPRGSCRDIGIAATPGTSPHGWASAVDLAWANHPWAFPTVKTVGQVTDEKWLWLNKYSGKYNYLFNVDGEHWHLGWIPIGTVTNEKIKTSKKRWDPTGVNDTTVLECLPTQTGENGNPPCGPSLGAGDDLSTTTPPAKTAAELAKEAADKEDAAFEAEMRASHAEQAKQLEIDSLNCTESALDHYAKQDETYDRAYEKLNCENDREKHCADFAQSLQGAGVFTYDGTAVAASGRDCSGTSSFIKDSAGRFVPVNRNN